MGTNLTYIGHPTTTQYSDEDIVHYSIINDIGGHFYISPSGVLQLSKSLDRESVQSHDIIVIVRKGVYPFKSSHVNVIIDIIDARDNIPVFDQPHIDLLIPEDFKVGVNVTTVSAISKDSFPLIYSIVGGWGQTSFRINSSSGELTLAKPLRYNVHPFHRIIVRATNGLLTADTTISITVEDQQIPPEFMLTNYVFSVMQPVSLGEVIGYVLATDRDHDCGIYTGLTYSTNSVREYNDYNSKYYSNGLGTVYDYTWTFRYTLRMGWFLYFIHVTTINSWVKYTCLCVCYHAWCKLIIPEPSCTSQTILSASSPNIAIFARLG